MEWRRQLCLLLLEAAPLNQQNQTTSHLEPLKSYLTTYYGQPESFEKQCFV